MAPKFVTPAVISVNAPVTASTEGGEEGPTPKLKLAEVAVVTEAEMFT